MHELVIATTNKGKFEEIKAFLSQLHPKVRYIPLSEIKGIPEIVEDASTFMENAKKKAMIVSSFSKKPALADDSGLEVKGLGGRPGVLSARFAGPKATDEQNIQKLLEKTRTMSEEDRSATFKCAMVLCGKNGHTSSAMGELKGVVTDSPRGNSGFGYDPIFFIPSLSRTMAELTPVEKNRMSHRAKALEKISNQLTDFLLKA